MLEESKEFKEFEKFKEKESGARIQESGDAWLWQRAGTSVNRDTVVGVSTRSRSLPHPASPDSWILAPGSFSLNSFL